ncbi:MAG: hypothetical protein CMN85_10660 [Spongiibacteraceae bacterium]|nr:hypothetical protein [Spongiibacteraceae bacterium]
MTNIVYSHAGDKFYISTTAQSSNLDQTGFEALSFTQVTQVGSIGEYGVSTNMLSYDTLDTVVSQKAKGITNAGDPAIECARNSDDAGQLAMKVAGAPTYYNAHAFKVLRQDGSIDYLRGLVAGPVAPNGRNEDFDLWVFTLALVQEPLFVDATS